MDNYFIWISTAVIVLLVIGFFIGFARSWKRALIRLAIVGAVLAVSILIAPVITSALISNNVEGNVLTIFGFRLDFTELLSKLITNEEVLNDLTLANGTTNSLILSSMQVALNLVVFLGLFIIISLLALIIYGIVGAVLHHKSKKQDKEKPNGVVRFALRGVGGLIGTITMMFILFAFLTPVFGVMNICNKFVEEEPKASAASIECAAAANMSFPNLVCGRGHLYYTDDENLGQIETYLSSYDKLKSQYDNSAAGKIFNALGISTLGAKSFEYLSNVKQGELELNLTNEFVSVSKTYNAYKTAFVANEFDIKNNESVDAINYIFSEAKNSKIVEEYLTELLPTMCDRWSKGEQFLGMDFPVTGEYASVAKAFLFVFKTDDIDRISKNVEVLLGTVKVANDNDFISLIETENADLLGFFETNTTFIKDEVLNLIKAEDIKNNIPPIFNEIMQILYNQIVDEPAEWEENKLTNAEIAAINWDTESTIMQTIVNDLASVANSIKPEEDTPASTRSLLGSLTTFGEVIDNSRESAILSRPLKTFVSGMIKSNKMGLSDEVKDVLYAALVNNWDNSVENYSFANMLGAVEQSALFADDLASGNVDMSNLSGLLGEIVDNEEVKNTISDVIKKDVIDQLVTDKQDAKVLSSMLQTFVDNTDSSSINKDLEAAQNIVDMASVVKNSGEFVLEGETEADKQQAANDIVNSLTSSNATMKLLENANTATSTEDAAAIKQVTQSLSGTDVKYLKTAISNVEDTNNKALLNNIFGF